MESDALKTPLAPYDLAPVHGANLKILKEIDRICRKYEIAYMIDSGTLLEAVRHQGFIPWDDDADVAFTRENYERFAKVVRKELPKGMKLLEPHQLAGGEAFYDFTPRILYLHSKTHEDSPEMQYYEGRLNHLWVDLFIQDDLPQCKVKAAGIRAVHTLICGLAMGHRYELDHSKYGPLAKIAVKILAGAGKRIPMKTIRWLQRRLAVCGNGKNSRLRYYSNYQPDYLHVTIEKQWNDRTVDLPFEDTVLMAPENWDQVLKQIYGDYMQLPPEKERVPTHSAIKIQVTG